MKRFKKPTNKFPLKTFTIGSLTAVTVLHLFEKRYSFALLTAPIASLSPLTALCRLTQAKEIEERSASETSYSLLCGLVIDRCIQ